MLIAYIWIRLNRFHSYSAFHGEDVKRAKRITESVAKITIFKEATKQDLKKNRKRQHYLPQKVRLQALRGRKCQLKDTTTCIALKGIIRTTGQASVYSSDDKNIFVLKIQSWMQKKKNPKAIFNFISLAIHSKNVILFFTCLLLYLSILRTSNSNEIEQKQIWIAIEEVVYNVKIKNFYILFYLAVMIWQMWTWGARSKWWFKKIKKS